MTRLRKLKLWFVQKNMRREVEENQMEVMKLNDRTYRRFVRDCNRTRFEMFKAGEKAKSDRAQERAQAAKRMKVCADIAQGVLICFLTLRCHSLIVHRPFEIFVRCITKGF